MKRLFVFAIGGTGSRVIKAMTMLAASGVKFNAQEIIPIIVDPDQANGDMNRTLNMLRSYCHIQKDTEALRTNANTPDHFFNQRIASLAYVQSEVQTEDNGDFLFPLGGVHNQEFKDFIKVDQQGIEDRRFSELLFSKKNLSADMVVGFKGNPNIGSVVLNQWKDSDLFNQFVQSYTSEDGIFIISSIFGGTGAAGFPLLVKTIRDSAVDNAELANAKIGAISVQPYFQVEVDDDAEVNTATFIDKTKAAMLYYERTLWQANKINAFYTIGENNQNMLENNEGAEAQKNNAHFVEIASALAIHDFARTIGSFETINGKVEPSSKVYKEFGVEDCAGAISFQHLPSNVKHVLRQRLIQFHLFTAYCKQGYLQDDIDNAGWTTDKFGQAIDPDYLASDQYHNLANLLNHYSQWISELKDSFHPFDLNSKSENALFDFVIGAGVKRGLFSKGHSEQLTAMLNKAVNSDNAQSSKLEKLLSCFEIASAKVATEKIPQ